MSITCLERPVATIVTVGGELNALESQHLKTFLVEAIAAGTSTFIIDLANVPFIDSSGLGALVSGLKQAKLAGGTLVLAALRDQARMIFEITMAFRIFDVFDTTDEALVALTP
jgi:anti-sigma B factor antagonist